MIYEEPIKPFVSDDEDETPETPGAPNEGSEDEGAGDEEI
jgi:hypothetical protein